MKLELNKDILDFLKTKEHKKVLYLLEYKRYIRIIVILLLFIWIPFLILSNSSTPFGLDYIIEILLLYVVISVFCLYFYIIIDKLFIKVLFNKRVIENEFLLRQKFITEYGHELRVINNMDNWYWRFGYEKYVELGFVKRRRENRYRIDNMTDFINYNDSKYSMYWTDIQISRKIYILPERWPLTPFMHINDNVFYHFEITILQKKKNGQINSLIDKLEKEYQVVYQWETNKIHIKFNKKHKNLDSITFRSVFNRLDDYIDWYTESWKIKNIVDESLKNKHK
jgi:hypothetical protein